MRDTKTMLRTSVDIFELPNSYMFILYIPSLKANHIKVDNNVLHIVGKVKKNK
eukprot:Gb_29726 [translate_table: standard]